MIAPVVSFSGASGQTAERPVTYNLYFGDLHSHTTYSDAWEGTPEDAYAAAKAAGADFLATTDHHYALTPEEWAATLETADRWTSPDFVAIAAYEYWMPGSGEINVFNAAEIPMIVGPSGQGNPGNHAKSWDALPVMYDWLSRIPGASAQWNHPDYMTKEFVSYGYWTEARDRAMNIFEIHNYGSWAWQDTLDYESSYVKALDKGWHVMPAANSDTHSPDWISGYESRTVLLAPSLNRADLYEAMSACRGYATLDKNLEVSYTLDGQIMGSTLAAPEAGYTASVHIEDPDASPDDAITMVEVVSDGGRVVARIPVSGTTVDLTIALGGSGAHYFYLRISSASNVSGGPGVTAWTAPVWTGL